MAWAKSAADRVAHRFGVERIDRARLDQFRSEQGQRSLYLFDVRDPPEYVAGHVAGAVSAPGGQLVQATDHYVGTLGARVVLVDDKEVRALMTASWLRRMGWKDVFVLVEAGGETGWPDNPVLGAEPTPELRIDCAELAALLAREGATVIDLSTSRSYRAAHIPGAWFAIRSRLAPGLARISAARHLGSHFRGRCPGRHGGTRSTCADDAAGPLSRGRQCGMVPSGICAIVRWRQDGGRPGGSLAQALRTARRH